MQGCLREENKLKRIPLGMANEQGQAHTDNLDLGPKLQCGVAMAMNAFLCASWGEQR